MQISSEYLETMVFKMRTTPGLENIQKSSVKAEAWNKNEADDENEACNGFAEMQRIYYYV